MFPFHWTNADQPLPLPQSSYPTAVPFPHLDAFPNTLFETSEQELGIRAALTTTSETGTRLKDLSHMISKAVEMDTREELMNNLAELREAYEEGWQIESGSGEDDD